MDLKLDGHKVLITAGAAGIGRAVAEAFLGEGAEVMVCDVDAEALAGLPKGIVGLHCDVTDRAATAEMVGAAVSCEQCGDCWADRGRGRD